MRVLHVNDCAGVARNLITGLKRFGIEAEHFQPVLGTYRSSKIVRLCIPITRTREALWLRKYVKQQGFDIVHIHYARFAYMALITGLPYVLHIHGSDLRVDINRHGLRELTLLAIRKADQVYYSTPDLKNALIKIRKDAIFLPNPIDTNDFKEIESSNVNPDRKRILSISKLDKMKGVEQILSAIEKILRMNTDVEVVIITIGNDKEKAGAFFNKHKTDPRVIPISGVPHDKMPELINSATFVLGQQSQEVGAFGVSELEAMACAKPVVCFFAYPESYSTPPPILISNSPEEACEHMLRLLSDEDYCNKIGRASKNWISTYHDLNSVAQKLLDLYSRVL
ncbi:MAG: glycosyltransferase family 4 protein [Bacteroidales bacterium]|nr:glycosyltransferase family 4 protein [Bacteroidales bacterium]